MFDRFDESLRRAIILAQEESRSLSHNHVGTEHLLLGVLRVREEDSSFDVEVRGITYKRARANIERIEGYGYPSLHTTGGFTRKSKVALEMALRKSLLKSDGYVCTEHLLDALSEYNGSVAHRVLVDQRLAMLPLHIRLIVCAKEFKQRIENKIRACLGEMPIERIGRNTMIASHRFVGIPGLGDFLDYKQREKRTTYQAKVAARKGK